MSKVDWEKGEKVLTEKHKNLYTKANELEVSINEFLRMLHPCREVSIAKTKIDEAFMWINKHIEYYEENGI
jgi:hypothetical protein